MRDFQLPGRSAAYASTAMAATSHPLATLTALDMLKAGGLAADAAVAACAVQCVVEPQSTGIGGDCWALYSPKEGGVTSLNSSGWTPSAISAEGLRGEGLEAMPDGGVASVTVPGAVRGWQALLDRHGSMGLDELLRPAIGYARNGFPVTPRVAFDWARATWRLERSAAGRDFYLPGGAAPVAGDTMRLEQLGATLETIARRGADAFYEGPLAAAMTASLKSFGGLHGEADFAEFRPEWTEPISATYRGHTVYQCPPNGQGVIALLLLQILEQLELEGLDPNGAERLHLEAEATRLAFRDRDAVLADPRQADVPTDRLLDKAYAAALAARIDASAAMPALPPPLLPEHKDTIYLTVVDRDGNACSFINSLYDSFGSGLVCPATGVIFHNRGRAFSLAAGHLNEIAPRKRPMHTIIPGLAFKEGAIWTTFGVMGGDYQPVGHAHLLTNLIDFGMDPQEAIDAPRAMAYPGPLQVERGVPAATVRRLAELGHAPVEAASPLGGGQAIMVDRARGVLVGGSDPRKDGLALGY
ncbi:MAG: gamma-glutamyltransferase [Geminicoccaceae bacterium]|nr:gamma-glutamyltransferase [Geminicoccaceae bacterium]